MAYAMQQHLAPRMIKLHNFLGVPMEVYNSIIAGCLQSVPMTRVYNKNVVDNNQGVLQSMSDPETGGLGKTDVYVDDCAQTCRHPSAGIFENRIMNSVFLFVKLRNRLKLTLSSKGKLFVTI